MIRELSTETTLSGTKNRFSQELKSVTNAPEFVDIFRTLTTFDRVYPVALTKLVSRDKH